MRRITIHDVGLALILVAVARASFAAPPAQATGTITGTVTDGSGPVASATVFFLTSSGGDVGWVQTNASGAYASPGLPGGSYYVRVMAPYESGLVDELYNDIPCPFGTCALTAGTIVPVTAGANTSDINFVLAVGGWFQGTITNQQTGTPVAEAWVSVQSAAGQVGIAPLTPASGAYKTYALPPGIYYLEAFAPRGSGLRNERYQNVFCEGVACLATTGDAVPITTAAGTTIDFALEPGAVIAGTVRRAPSNSPLANVRVDFYAANGLSAGATATDAFGQYTSPGLPPGTYFLQTETSPAELVVDELYSDIPCPDRACMITSGTPVAVSGTGTFGNIDFTLSPGGTISGTITNSVSHAALFSVLVRFRNAAGAHVAIAWTHVDGSYTSPGLPSGTYYVTAGEEPTAKYAGELYNNLPCYTNGCSTAGGTLITVASGEVTPGVDFALDPVVAPAVTKHPSPTAVWEGQIATFTAAATGVPPPSAQWQVSVDGGATWDDVYGATSATYAFGTVRADIGSGKRVRAVFSNVGGSATTGAATLTVTPCEFSLSPAASAPYTGSSATITVQTGAGCAWAAVSNAPWLTVLSGASGVGNGSVGYTVAAYSGTVPRTGTLAIAGRAVQVTQFGVPTAALDRTSLSFTATTNGSAFVAATPAQSVRLTLSAPGLVTWNATPSQPWLTVSPQSGTGQATLTVGIAFAAGLPMLGTSDADVTLSFAGAANIEAKLRVTLNVLPENTSRQPFGRIDSPLDGATGIAGSIAVTGWSLDDVGVTRVLILRDPVSGEGTAPVYIGDATFVDGARPDVHALYQAYPQSTRAGWGYMLLTNFLPERGNGRFRLHAVALDVDAHVTTIGSATITCDNANSDAPFGAIDTPGQGETWAGDQTNFGWVLSPGSRRADPPGGGVVNVFIDGVNVGSPTGWTARSDISALFPAVEYQGVSNAVAGFGVDTRLLSNGVHSIFWVVTASSGGAAGVGSRYFTVANAQVSGLRGTASLTQSEARVAAGAVRSSAVPAATEMARRTGLADVNEIVNRAPVDLSTIRGRRGFDLQSALTDFAAEDGRTVVRAEELDRVELRLAAAAGHTFTGYLRTIDGLGPLPIGSALDSATGTFTWGAGPGFIGTYDLAFVRWIDGDAVARQDVRVVISPKGSNRVGPQVVIDVPVAGQDRPAVVDRSFFLSGWAIDLDSPADPGIDVVHVWAYPVEAAGTYGTPRFLGQAIVDGSRRDVGALYGLRFEKSGYGMIVKDLPPGTFDIAVFAHSTLRGGFAPAKTVRVTVR